MNTKYPWECKTATGLIEAVLSVPGVRQRKVPAFTRYVLRHVVDEWLRMRDDRYYRKTELGNLWCIPDIQPRTVTVLKKYGITTVSQLCSMTEAQLTAMRGFGDACRSDVVFGLHKLGLT